MKKLLTAVFMGFLVEIAAIATELPSLPIGSTNALVAQSVSLVNEVWLDIAKVVNGNSWTVLYSAPIIRYSKEADGPLDEFIRVKLKEFIDRSIDPNDASLAGVQFESWYMGLVIDPLIGLGFQGMLGTHNSFTLKEYLGKLSVPDEAYKVDIDAAVMRGIVHAFLVPKVERATLVARDRNGRVVKEFDSRDPDIPYTPRVGVEEGILYLPRDYIANATPGEVTIWYKDNTSQTFDLATGKLLTPVTTRLEIQDPGAGQLRLIIIASAGTSYVLESSSDVAWTKVEAIGVLAAGQMSASGFREYRITPSGAMKFFRARLVSPQ